MKKVRVLVVDDSPFSCSIISDALTEGGFEVVGTANSLEEAVEQYRPYRACTVSHCRHSHLRTAKGISFKAYPHSKQAFELANNLDAMVSFEPYPADIPTLQRATCVKRKPRFEPYPAAIPTPQPQGPSKRTVPVAEGCFIRRSPRWGR
jgi:CheY-like chemotaxis protein